MGKSRFRKVVARAFAAVLTAGVLMVPVFNIQSPVAGYTSTHTAYAADGGPSGGPPWT